MKSVVLPFAFALSALSGAAVAGGFNAPVAEPAIATPAEAPAQLNKDWTGAYMGLAYGRHDATLSLGSISIGADDQGLGLFAGYNQDYGQYVIGGELSYDRVKDQGATVEMTRLKARLGYDAGVWMPYATMGLAQGQASDETGVITESGLTYGFGADFAVSENVVIGAELTRSTFANIEGTALDLDIDSIQIRAAYKF